jgi:cation transport ATPase
VANRRQNPGFAFIYNALGVPLAAVTHDRGVGDEGGRGL